MDDRSPDFCPDNDTYWTAEKLISLSSSYWQVCVLHASVETALFTVLADAPLTDAELAVKAGISPRGARALGTALCAMRLCSRQQGRIALTDAARRYLVKESPDYVGSIITHHHHLMAGWTRLDKAALEGLPMTPPNESNPVSLAAFLRGMANMASMRAGEVVQQLDLSHASRLMDLGGGPGSYAVAFCEKNPSLQAVIYDRPTTQPFAMETIKAHNLEDRISFVSGNILTDPLPDGFDAVWLSHVLHSSPPEDAALMCCKAVRSLNPGGSLYVQEFFLDDSMDGPLFPALFNCNMLQVTSGGQSYAWKEIEAMLRDAGCVTVKRLPKSKNPGIGVLQGIIS